MDTTGKILNIKFDSKVRMNLKNEFYLEDSGHIYLNSVKEAVSLPEYRSKRWRPSVLLSLQLE